MSEQDGCFRHIAAHGSKGAARLGRRSKEQDEHERRLRVAAGLS